VRVVFGFWAISLDDGVVGCGVDVDLPKM